MGVKRIKREKDTLSTMIHLYCQDHHKKKKLCEDCYELNQYALMRVDKCKFGKEKPVCKDCKVHCYQHFQRDKIREVMRHSGPKMTFRYPYLAVMHFVDSWFSR